MTLPIGEFMGEYQAKPVPGGLTPERLSVAHYRAEQLRVNGVVGKPNGRAKQIAEALFAVRWRIGALVVPLAHLGEAVATESGDWLVATTRPDDYLIDDVRALPPIRSYAFVEQGDPNHPFRAVQFEVVQDREPNDPTHRLARFEASAVLYAATLLPGIRLNRNSTFLFRDRQGGPETRSAEYFTSIGAVPLERALNGPIDAPQGARVVTVGTLRSCLTEHYLARATETHPEELTPESSPPPAAEQPWWAKYS